MQYLLLIYSSETIKKEMSQEAHGEMYREYMAYTKELKESGAMVAGDGLQDTDTATTIRVENGTLSRTDGPFAETKEQLGGYYLVEAADLDEAVKWAEKIPTAKYGSIEIRPIMTYE